MMRILGMIFFIMMVELFFSEPTDADINVSKSVSKNVLAASTLDFSKKDTVNGESVVSLFSVNGLVPGGFSVKSVRIKNEGKINFVYKLSSEFRTGDEILFNKIRIRVIKNWVEYYVGYLKDFEISLDENLVKDDLVLVLSLDDDSKELANRRASFYLKVRTDNSKTGNHFFVEQILDNDVTSGSW